MNHIQTLFKVFSIDNRLSSDKFAIIADATNLNRISFQPFLTQFLVKITPINDGRGSTRYLFGYSLMGIVTGPAIGYQHKIIKRDMALHKLTAFVDALFVLTQTTIPCLTVGKLSTRY